MLRNFRRAPIAHITALLLSLLFALPLFLLKIEEIPADLLWTLSVVFVVFSWPSRIAVGAAYRRGTRKTNGGRWWIRWPQILMAVPISAAFVAILFFSRYIAWHGAFSMIENHVFSFAGTFLAVTAKKNRRMTKNANRRNIFLSIKLAINSEPWSRLAIADYDSSGFCRGDNL